MVVVVYVAPPIIRDPAGSVNVWDVPDPCFTNIVPVSPTATLDIAKVLFPPKVTLEFEPLARFQDSVAASVKVNCVIFILLSTLTTPPTSKVSPIIASPSVSKLFTKV